MARRAHPPPSGSTGRRATRLARSVMSTLAMLFNSGSSVKLKCRQFMTPRPGACQLRREALDLRAPSIDARPGLLDDLRPLGDLGLDVGRELLPRAAD